MQRQDALFGILAIAAGVFVITKANANIGDYLPSDYVSNDPAIIPSRVTMPTTEQKTIAFMAMIRNFEANGDYGALVGGRKFYDFSKHPASPDGKPPLGWKMNSAETNYYNPTFNSSAAGAYQDIYSTWKPLADSLGLTDYTPASQDAANYELLRQIGVIDAIDADDIDSALRLASAQWASLPYSTANQHPKTVAMAMNTYNNYLG